MTQITRPESISGGCLCGDIRYTVTCEKWPMDASNCQCTMCRKFSSALISDALVLKPHQLSPGVEELPKQFPSFKWYHSGPKTKRGFCSNCSSGILWASEAQSDILILFAGTIDEEILCGQKDEDSKKKTEYGSEYKWKHAHGAEICKPNMGQQYWAHAIPGLTDHDYGSPRFLQTDQDGKPLPKDWTLSSIGK